MQAAWSALALQQLWTEFRCFACRLQLLDSTSSKYHVASAKYHMAIISCKEKVSKQVAEEVHTTCDTGVMLLPCVLPKGQDEKQARDQFVVLDANGQQTAKKIGQYQLVHMNSSTANHTERALINPVSQTSAFASSDNPVLEVWPHFASIWKE